MELFLSFILSTLISLLLIPLLIKSAGFLGMVDEPGERKVHQKAIPRCGGLGLAAAMLITVLLLLPIDTPYRGLILGGAIIVVFGALDDVLNLHYRWKFLGQFLAVLLVMQQGIYLDYLPFNGIEPAPKWIAYPITFLFVVGVTNAVNLSDGLDGLAAGIMLMTLALIAFLAADSGGWLPVMALALIGGILGFLRFNSHPAIVFMGDTGSQFIGFMVAFLSICLVSDVHVVLNPALPLLLLGLPVLDTLMVMTQRIALRLSPFSPDKRHIHHKLLAFGLTHAEAVACIYVLQSVFLVAAFCWRYQSDWLVIGGYLMICTVILALFFGGDHLGWRLRDVEVGSDRRRGFLRQFDGLYKGARVYIEYALLLYLLVMILVMSDKIDAFSSRDQWLLMMVVALVGLVKKPMSDALVKLSVYVTATFSGFVLTTEALGIAHIDSVVNSFLAALMLVTFLAIRVTRRSVFTLSTQDMLISFFVLAVFLLADTKLPVGILFKLLCMAYAIEYLFTFSLRRYRLLRFVAVVAGIMVLSLLIQDNTQSVLDAAEQLNG